MEKNIFENAFFGKAYKTRDGRKVIFLRTFVGHGYNHYVSTGDLEYSVREDGKVDKHLYPYEEDIVSEWEEEINEEELEKLAKRNNIYDRFADDFECENYYGFIEGFKIGYRKAKEE